MLGRVKALISSPIKRRLKAALEYIAHAPAIIRLALCHRKRFSINLISRDRKVAFVSDAPTWREMKLAYGLRRAGWDVTLLHGQQALSLDLKSFHDVRPYGSPWEAVELAHKAGTRVFHNFSHFGDKTSIRLLQNKPGRVVYDFYDSYFSIFDGLKISPEKLQQVDDRLYCLENADAICARDLQLQYRRHEKGIATGKPLILFSEYCWDNTPLPERRADGEVHIAQVGWMGLETRGEEDTGGYWIFEKFVQAGCHLHIYLHPVFPPLGSAAFEAAFADYLELGRKTGRVHLYPTVSPEKLIGELAKYDFGASVSNGLVFDIPWSHQNPVRFPLCGSSRLYDYLDAGLGMVIHKQLKFMTRTYRDAGIVHDAGQLLAEGDIKSALARRPARDAFQRARTALSLDRNIGRLTRFYETLK